jgi:hypothetical protein
MPSETDAGKDTHLASSKSPNRLFSRNEKYKCQNSEHKGKELEKFWVLFPIWAEDTAALMNTLHLRFWETQISKNPFFRLKLKKSVEMLKNRNYHVGYTLIFFNILG